VMTQGCHCQTTEKFQANKAAFSERGISLATRRLVSKVYPVFTLDIPRTGYTSTTTLVHLPCFGRRVFLVAAVMNI
jgi:hypothetical protein